MINVVVLIVIIAIVVSAVVVQIRNRKGGGCSCSSCADGVCSPSENAKDKNTVYPDSSSLTLDITGMHCEKCSLSVTEALNELDGVSAVVNLKDNSAAVTLSKPVSAKILKEAVEQRGFELIRIRQA